MDNLTGNELYRIGVALTSAEMLEEVLDTLLLETVRILKAPAGSVALYDEDTERLTLKASTGFSAEFSQVACWEKRKGGMTDHILGKRVPTVISDVAGHSFADNAVLLKEGIKSLVAVPLFTNNRAVGVLYVDDFMPRFWTQKEVEFLTLLGIQAAYAIQKFRLIDELSEAKTYLQNVLDHSEDIIMTTNTETEIVEFNKGASRILGYTREEMVGRRATQLWVNPREREEALEIVKREGFISNYETQLKTKQGNIIDISLTLSTLKNKEGTTIGTVGISKDITEKKRLERALEERNHELQELNENLENKIFERMRDIERVNRELERSNKLKSQFIATMSHELRTPLNSILGFSELLLDGPSDPLTERQNRYVQNIHNSGSHLLQLINNVLDLAKIESGKIQLHYERFAVGHAINEVEAVIRSLINKKKQTLVVKADAAPVIQADRVKFKQVLYNLLSNAVKFTPEGGLITLEVEVTGDPGADNAGKLLKVLVRDTGIGIKKEDLERIFSEFEQGDSSFSRRYEGTGLGLALTRRLVELHGGEIFAESEEGAGSTFTLTLPLIYHKTPEALLPVQAGVGKKALHNQKVVQPKPLRSLSPLILVVEDDQSTSEVLTLYLAQGGYRVARAYNGDEALQRMRELKPFAVLLDIMLPGKDGWEILQEAKSDAEVKDIPIIIASVIDNKELGFALGATDYLVKPVDKTMLYGKLEELNSCLKRSGELVSILCIDDQEDTLDTLKAILESAHYTVFTANSGSGGIEKALLHKPDLIILDLMMSGMDGFNVVQTLKSNIETGDIPVLALTAKDLTVDDRLRLAGKIEQFIQKNHFTKEDLLMYIHDLEMTYPARAGFLDEVSGLLDNCYFHLRIAQEVSRTSRFKGTFTAIILDLDHFTDYIKAHGIHRANICIRKISEILRKNLRGSDLVVRYGIDEFAVMLANTLKSPAEIVAKRFLSFIEQYSFYGAEVMPHKKITTSIAIINYPHDAASAEEIIFKAHQLLRTAKAKGGRRIEYYE